MRMLLGVGLLLWSWELWAADADSALQAIRSYEAGGKRGALVVVQNLVSAATSESARQELAAALATMLKSGATIDAKRFVCAQLSLVAGDAEVPALAACLAQKELAHAARAALERIPGEAALAALRKALTGAEGVELAGIIDSLGTRRDAKAVATLTPLLGDSRLDVVEATLDALGKIGTAEAVGALAGAGKTIRPRFMSLRAEALLKCAARFADAGAQAQAVSIYLSLAAAESPEPIRTAALLGLLGATGDDAAKAVKAAVTRDDPAIFFAVLRTLALREGADTGALKNTAIAFLGATKNARLKAQAAMLVFKLNAPRNLALGASASSPDDLEKDGQASGDQAAIDDNLDTYWDEVDGKSLYRLQVTFAAPTAVSLIRIVGFNHHNYAPKNFEVLCDGKVVATVVNAQYASNELLVPFAEVSCTALELKITAYYGQSPAIRELGIYRCGADGR